MDAPNARVMPIATRLFERAFITIPSLDPRFRLERGTDGARRPDTRSPSRRTAAVSKLAGAILDPCERHHIPSALRRAMASMTPEPKADRDRKEGCVLPGGEHVVEPAFDEHTGASRLHVEARAAIDPELRG